MVYRSGHVVDEARMWGKSEARAVTISRNQACFLGVFIKFPLFARGKLENFHTFSHSCKRKHVENRFNGINTTTICR